MNEQAVVNAWLDLELEKIDIEEKEHKCYEEREGLEFEEDKITVVEIDFSKPFKEWKKTNDNDKKVVKSIIPCVSCGNEFFWWLNKRNPIYKDVIRGGRKGQTLFKIFRTGQKENTKYSMVKE